MQEDRNGLLSNSISYARSTATVHGTVKRNVVDGETHTIGAGAVRFLLEEGDLIKQDQESVRRLRMIARNLRPIIRAGAAAGNGAIYSYAEDHWSVSEEDLEFLGF